MSKLISKITFKKINNLKGARSPDVRGVSTGVFPIQSLKSKAIESDGVSFGCLTTNIFFIT